MIRLFDFQQRAAAQMAERFARYMADRPLTGTEQNRTYIPFYQALASITGSGKTAILAQAVTEIQPVFPIKPLVLWLSKGRVVVSQTYTNLQDRGKYHHLLSDFAVRLLSEYDVHEVADTSRSFIYFATVGTFNQKDKEKGERLIFRSEIDTAERSTWEELKRREDVDGVRRPLVVVYDEAQNLTDQQTELLLELQPDLFLVASATMKLPPALSKVLEELKRRGWSDDQLTTSIASSDVANSGLIKRDVILGGYEAAMEQTIQDLLADLKKARTAAAELGVQVRPKAIYVCKTNIKETNSFQRDDPKRPFAQREAPPILIWRFLVEEKKVDPSKVAVYSSLEFDNKRFPPPPEFVQFRGGEKDYEDFISQDFEHVIFNLTLQEGWDDPECYFAYIDKSMGSSIQVEQVIGRVLRQPFATHFETGILNAAHFYVRIDRKGVFQDIVEQVRGSVAGDGLDIRFSSYIAGSKGKPKLLAPKKRKEVPRVYLDSKSALKPVQKIIDTMSDFRKDKVNTVGKGSRALVQQRVGDPSDPTVTWKTYAHNNSVSARWIFQLEVGKQFQRALEVTGSDDPKFDARIELGSRAEEQIRQTATAVVEAYLQHVHLGQQQLNPYVVRETSADPSKLERFKNALHDGYSGLNRMELPFARELDTTKLAWCRNPSMSGFGIPLLSLGSSKTFYPDFLVWRGNTVFAIDTTGQHLLEEKTGRKLLSIKSKRGGQRLIVKLVSEGRWHVAQKIELLGKEGYTVWHLRQDRNLGFKHFDSIRDTVKECVKAPSG